MKKVKKLEGKKNGKRKKRAHGNMEEVEAEALLTYYEVSFVGNITDS